MVLAPSLVSSRGQTNSMGNYISHTIRKRKLEKYAILSVQHSWISQWSPSKRQPPLPLRKFWTRKTRALRSLKIPLTWLKNAQRLANINKVNMSPEAVVLADSLGEDEVVQLLKKVGSSRKLGRHVNKLGMMWQALFINLERKDLENNLLKFVETGQS